MRLDKYITDNTIYSRKNSRNFIKGKRIFVNKLPIQDISFQVNGSERIEFNHKVIKSYGFIYHVIDKPKGYVSAIKDKKHKVITELIPIKYSHLNLKPVGRLDKNTTGLIILTNDNDFIHNMTNPKNNIIKKYLVTLIDPIKNNYKEDIVKGILLKDGTTTKSGTMEIISNNECYLIITEGKYHQVKRMFAALGNKVIELRRIQFGEYTI